MVLSKLLELYILEQCENYEFAESQYGYIKGRGTDLDKVMAHDMCEYCVAQGSSVYMCSLDVEGAYDTVLCATFEFKKSKQFDVRYSNVESLNSLTFENQNRLMFDIHIILTFNI